MFSHLISHLHVVDVTLSHFYESPLLTIALCHYEANSQLATHTQPQVQEPSAYWSLHSDPKKKKKLWLCIVKQ